MRQCKRSVQAEKTSVLRVTERKKYKIKCIGKLENTIFATNKHYFSREKIESLLSFLNKAIENLFTD
jgi:hypothetical protein